MQLSLAYVCQELTQRIIYVLFVEQDMNTLEASVIRSHTEILQARDRMHTGLRHVLLSQYNRKLFRTVVTIVEEDHDIAFLDNSNRLSVLNVNDRLDELVRYTLGVRLFHRFYHALGLLTLTFDQ